MMMPMRDLSSQKQRRTGEEMVRHLESFEMDMGRLPTQEEGLRALVSKGALEDEEQAKKWRGPYLDKTPKDQWGNELVYEPIEGAGGEDEPTKPYKLSSKGKDGDAQRVQH